MALIDKNTIIEVIERNIGRTGDDDGYERIADEVLEMIEGGWLSIWEHHPDRLEHLDNASIPVIWFDANDNNGLYGQPCVHTGNFYFLDDNPRSKPYATYLNGRTYLSDPSTNEKRDIYWKPLPVNRFPKPVKR
jgi:hypothetical protein